MSFKNVPLLLLFGSKNCKDLEYPNCYVGSLSRLVKSDLAHLKSTAQSSKAVSLSANQIRSEHNMFVIRQKIEDNRWFYEDKGYFSTYINPKILKVSEEITEEWEYCPSFPWLRAKVPRYQSIKVEYDDDGLHTKEKSLEGFAARVFQHELDHLRGLTLINWRLNHLGLEYLDQEKNDENEEILEVLAEMKKKIQEAKIKHPKRFRRGANELNTRDVDIDNKIYFDMDLSREKMQIFGFEEEIYEKLVSLFSRKIAFSNY